MYNQKFLVKTEKGSTILFCSIKMMKRPLFIIFDSIKIANSNGAIVEFKVQCALQCTAVQLINVVQLVKCN